MNNFFVWVESLPPNKAKSFTMLAVLLSLVSGTIGYLVGVAMPLFGCAAGVLLLAAAAMWWEHFLSEDRKTSWDVKNKVPLLKRRVRVTGIGLLWAFLLTVSFGGLPVIMMGTLNVFVVGILVWLWMMTDQEKADLLAALEEEKAAEELEKALLEEDMAEEEENSGM